MNRHLFRIVFNRARGALMAVQESASGSGKAAGGDTARIAAPLLLLCAGLVQAQIVADPGAPAGQRPTVLLAPNRTPLVNIQTPSAAGVSRNTYQQFDVDAPGAILNNSRVNTQTQLGGWVQGNPSLARGSARVILNEVNSVNPSHLRGAVEVAGQRAEVVIANPAGISVDGGSFINARRVTLTTGSPVIDEGGSLDSYRVQRGRISFEGRGADFGGADYAGVVARAIEVNAGIRAQHLTVVAGAHEATADGLVATPIAGTGPAPQFLLDVKDIGGMYAGHIFLRGTEAGLGVRNAGTIASTGALTLSSDGSVTNSGTVQATGALTVSSAQALGNSGAVLGQADVALRGATIANSGTVQAGGTAHLAATAGKLDNRAGTVSASRLDLQSAADIDNTGGTLRQTGAGLLQLATASLDNSAGGTVGNRPAAEPGGAGTGPAAGTGTPAPTDTTGLPVGATPPAEPAPATVTPDLTPGTVHAEGVLVNAGGTVTSGGGIGVAAARIDNSGGFLAVDRIEGRTEILNAHGDLRVAGDLSATGAVLDNRAGSLVAGGRLQVSVGRVDNAGGVAQATAMDIAAQADIDNSAGTLRATAADGPGLGVRAGGALHNGAGHVESATGATLAADRVDGDAGSVVALGDLAVRTTGDALNHQGTWTAGGALRMEVGGTLDIRGAALDAARAMRIDAQALDNRGGRIAGGAGVGITTTAGLLNDGGLVNAAAGLDVSAGAALSNRAGTLESAGTTGAMDVRAAAIDNSAGRIVNAGTGATTIASTGALDLGTLGTAGAMLGGNGVVDIGAGSLHVASGSTLAAGAALSVVVADAATNAGTIVSAGAANVSASSLDNRTGRIEAADTLAVATRQAIDNRAGTLRAGHALAVTAGTDIANDHGAIEATAADATLAVHAGATLDNAAGRIANAGNGAATLAAGRIVNGATGAMLANGDLRLRSATLDNQAGATVGAGALTVDVSTLVTNRGAIASNGTLVFAQPGAALDNRAGRVTAIGNIDLQLQRLDNAGGTVSADGDLHMALAGDLTNAGLLHAGRDLGLDVSGALVNTGTLEAGGTLRTDSASLANARGAVLQASRVDLHAGGALVNAGEIVGTHVDAHADSIANTGAITGGDLTLTARSIANAGGTALVGATGTLALNGSQSVTNTDGATLYSAGDIAITTAAFVNRSATIEAGRDIGIDAASVLNERPVLAQGQVQSLAESHSLTMPSWWHNDNGNGNSYAGSVNATNFSAHQVYYLDPADILETGSFVTPDGQRIGRAVVRTHADDTSYFSARAGLYGAYGHRERVTVADGTQVIYYLSRADDVANPDQVAGAAATAPWPGEQNITSWDTAVPTDPAYGRCTTRCVVLTTQWQYTDPTTTIIRDTQRVLGPSTALSELRRDVTTSATDDTISLGAAARIAAGGNIRIGYSDSMTNRFGDVIAGGRLDIVAATAGAGTVTNEAVTLYRRYIFAGTSTFANNDQVAWIQPDISQVIGGARGVLSGVQGVGITGQTVRNIDLSAGSAANIVDRVQLASGGQPPPSAAPSSAAAAGQVGSTQAAAGGFIDRPGALFAARPQAGVPYLYETRPAFTNYRDWLSSDYLLKALGIDPAATQKRLGDGFYEQRLINEQVEQLTGRRYLAGYTTDLDQYQALLDAGVTYARQYGLAPGVSLSASQMAQLTSDIVWLQSESVTLADGSTQQVLVPHVYLARQGGGVPDGVLASDGAVITGGALHIDAGTLLNRGGVIGGAGTHSAILVASADVVNQGGTIAAGLLGIHAGGDIRNESLAVTQDRAGSGSTQSATSASNVARIAAGQALVMDAGRDVLGTAGEIGSGGDATVHAGRDVVFDPLATGNSEQIRVGSITGAQASQHNQGSNVTVGGNLSLDAGRDITLTATQVQAGQDAVLVAGRNIAIGAANDTSSVERRSDDGAAPAFVQSRESGTSQGSGIRTGGNLGIKAGTQEPGDITVTGSTLDARGAAVLVASRDVNIVEARDTGSSHDENRSSHSGLLSSTASHTERDSASDTSAGSSVGGGTVLIRAGNDANVRGSNVVSDHGTAILAGHDINITAARNTETSSSLDETSKSGLMGSGGIGVTLGSRAQTSDRQTTGTTAQASTVGSIGGDVAMGAANRYTQTGSDVVAPAGDITIEARDVRITEARETSSTQVGQTSRQSGVTLAVTSPLLAAAQSTVATARAAGNTSDGRMQALGVASAAMNAGSAIGSMSGSDGGPAGGGVNLSLSLGSSSSRSSTTASSDTARGSTLQGRNVAIAAKGAGQDSNLLIRGSEVHASDTVGLRADNRVDIVAAQTTSEQHSQNSSQSASVGVSFGTDGFLVNASASGARGHADGSDVTQVDSHVGGGQRVDIKSGGDTTIAGGVVQAERVTADVGGDLRVESLQDSATFDSRQQSLGGSVSVGMGRMGGSLSISQSRTGADYASVKEQSGIQAGDGGFDVRVKGATTLIGGVIESKQPAVDAGKNVFETASLATSDIQNRDDFSASGFSLGGGYSSGGTGKASDGSQQSSVSGQGAVPKTAGGVDGTSAGVARASGHRSNTTTSGVSGIAGNADVRTGDSSGGLVSGFDADKVGRETGAQLQITSTFGQQAAKAVGDYADGKYKELEGSDPAEAAKWAEGGAYRVGAHTIAAGLTGGLQGALGAATSQLAIDEIGKQIARTELPVAVKAALVAAAGTAIGAVVGDAGAVGGFTATTNNYLSTADLTSKAQAVAACNGNSSCISTLQRASQDTSLANNAKVLDACQTPGGGCAGAIKKVEHDREVLNDYRDALEDEQSRASDAASRNAISALIRETDRQIGSANNAIMEGKLIEAGGDYTGASLTVEERMAIGFALDPVSPALNRLSGRVSLVLDKPTEQISTPTGIITVYRVEGIPNTRILIDDNGLVAIQGEQVLFLNFGERSRAMQYLEQKKSMNLAGAGIKSFDISRDFFMSMKESAVDEIDAKLFPNLPFIVDTTKAPNQMGIRNTMFNSLLDSVLHGSGRRE